MKGDMFNMSQDLFVIFFLWGRFGGDWPVYKMEFYGTEERNVSQGDILDTSLNPIVAFIHSQSSVPTMDEHACSCVH